MSAIHWSVVLAKIDLVSLYFRLLWYHSTLKGSIDQYSKIHSPLACSRWLPWFPDLSRPCVACVKRGSGETCVRSQSLSSESAVKSIPTCPTSVPRQAKKDSNIPSPGRTRLVKCPTPGPSKIIKSLPHALPPPPLPRRLYIDNNNNNNNNVLQHLSIWRLEPKVKKCSSHTHCRMDLPVSWRDTNLTVSKVWAFMDVIFLEGWSLLFKAE